MVAVLGSPTPEHLVARPELHRKLDVIDVVAFADLLKQPLGHLHVNRCAVELRIDNVVEIEVFDRFLL